VILTFLVLLVFLNLSIKLYAEYRVFTGSFSTKSHFIYHKTSFWISNQLVGVEYDHKVKYKAGSLDEKKFAKSAFKYETIVDCFSTRALNFPMLCSIINLRFNERKRMLVPFCNEADSLGTILFPETKEIHLQPNEMFLT
jgi:hypothetical protein